METAENNFSRLHQAMQRWVWRQGWTRLHPVQENSIRPILDGRSDVVISAPTAGGKTEAAFLPIISRLLENPEKPGFAAIAISPLKALINDQTNRLQEMTAGLDIDVTPWHGDVSQSVKDGAVNRPSGILIITPESLEAMFALRPSWMRDAFANLQYVVIDEFHAFMNSERGVQIQSLLGRLEHMTGRKIPRIAMSATIANVDGVAKYLRPDASLPCVVPESGDLAHQVQISVKEYVADATHNPEPLISEEIFARLRGSNNLVFTNSRKDAEAYTLSLTEMCRDRGVPNEFGIHHGSLSKLERKDVEKTLQKGHRPFTAICTASMELGIDIGKVSSVAQIGTADSPAILRQRLGRSGRRGTPSVLRIFSVDEQRDDYKFHLRSNLVQNVAVTELMREGVFDEPKPQWAFISIIVQQLLSMLSQYGSFYVQEAYELLCKNGAFQYLTLDDFVDLLRHLKAKNVIDQLASGQVVIGKEGERILASRDFFSAFTTPRDYNIIQRNDHRTIGTVQYKPYYGEVFILAGQKWIVEAVEEKSSSVYVSATHSKGKMMFEGSGIETSANVTRKMFELYNSDTPIPYLDHSTATDRQLQKAREWFHAHHLDRTPWMRQADTAVYFTWGGMKVNRTIALLANTLFDINPSYDHLAVSDLSPHHIEKMAAYLTSAELSGPSAATTPMPTSDLQPSGTETINDLTHPQMSNLESTENLALIGEFLASKVNRRKKERSKFDVYLPDTLLNREYAATRLDLPATHKILTSPSSLP